MKYPARSKLALYFSGSLYPLQSINLIARVTSAYQRTQGNKDSSSLCQDPNFVIHPVKKISYKDYCLFWDLLQILLRGWSNKSEKWLQHIISTIRKPDSKAFFIAITKIKNFGNWLPRWENEVKEPIPWIRRYRESTPFDKRTLKRNSVYFSDISLFMRYCRIIPCI